MTFLIREALFNLKRHKLMTTAAITTTAVALTLLGAFTLAFYQIDTATRRALAEFEMRAFCRTTLDKKAVAAVGKRIEALPQVTWVGYKSKKEAFEEVRKGLPIDVADVPNEMNDTFIIRLYDANSADKVARTIRGWNKEVEAVALPGQEMQAVQRLAVVLRNIGIVGSALLLAGALLVVSNTTRISVFTRRREIKIMQLVGATSWFIRLPLLLEGLLDGLIGGALASICLLLVGRTVAEAVAAGAPFLLRYAARVDALWIGLLPLLAGAFIGSVGSLAAIRRYLKT